MTTPPLPLSRPLDTAFDAAGRKITDAFAHLSRAYFHKNPDLLEMDSRTANAFARVFELAFPAGTDRDGNRLEAYTRRW